MAVILTADDDAAVRELLTFVLTRAGHDVLGAVDGIQAWERLEKIKPDLLVTDGDMPRMTGFELSRRLKTTPHLAGIPVLVISGSLTSAQQEAGLPFADECLAKPFEPGDLCAAVDRLLGVPIVPPE
jgi:two-component system chemotaxis response regulator CheY